MKIMNRTEALQIVHIQCEEALAYLYGRYKIVGIAVCSCGALTFEVERGIGYSVLRENAPSFFPELPETFFTYLDKFAGQYGHCNHCVNHWGLDLCACGSGETPEGCICGFDECGLPNQVLKEVCYDGFKETFETVCMYRQKHSAETSEGN